MKKIFFLSLLSSILFAKAVGQNKYIDSLQYQLVTAKEDTVKVNLLIKIAWSYAWSKPDTAILYGLQARQLSQKLNFAYGEIEVASLLTEAFCTKGNFSTALEIDLKVLQAANKSGNQNSINKCVLAIADVYFYSGDYQKALTNYLKYKTNEQDSSRAILAFIGEAYFHLNQLDSALFYINKAYNIDKNNSTPHWSVPYYYMAAIQAKGGRYKDALDNYKRGILFSNNRNLDITTGYNGIATLFKQIGQVDSSIYYAKQSIKLAQQESLIPEVIDAAALLTELYTKKNTDSAFSYQRLMLSAKDSLFSEGKVKQLQNLSFNQQMRDQEIQQEQEQFQSKLKIYALIIAVLVFLLITFFLYRNSRNKQKAYVLLQKQKQEIDYQKAQVEQTLAELRATQSQLIQSEKMASLGELIAGIAHEIQNPLNFVNNFSEINTELIEEMKAALNAGNKEEAISIGENVTENQQKINHHGKRADVIVKGMLQHSRSSSGVKEATDINALADEYLRLAYHGLRAKDKSFNATIKTDFDDSIGNINIVPQDIGRVILNLITNAFYAVDEKKKQQPDGYEPLVSVSTKKVGEKVEIRVKDNGNGILHKVLDKIFQPFFTTKPAGQGTGLGLSLSYDIIKAHGGEIKVETKEGEFTEFIIQLPNSFQ